MASRRGRELMKIGICAQVEQSADAKAAGFDFVEPNAQLLLQGHKSEWAPPKSELAVPSANVLVPASMKIVGPAVDAKRLHEYMTIVTRRAKQMGLKFLVFGSGGARNVPDGFDRDQAKRQIIEFCRDSAERAKQNDLTLVVEPLNRSECNIINTMDECVAYVKTVDHPNFFCLFDAYHFWVEDEPIEHVKAAAPFVRHVHLADKSGRVAPGESGRSDYRPLFRILRDNQYDGMLTVEAEIKNLRADGPRVIKFIKDQWQNC
jgi:sugar phosphate isomerase/epimerase